MQLHLWQLQFRSPGSAGWTHDPVAFSALASPFPASTRHAVAFIATAVPLARFGGLNARSSCFFGTCIAVSHRNSPCSCLYSNWNSAHSFRRA